MSSPWRKSRLRLGYRTPEAVPSSAPASVPLTLNPPPALVECATANITWTGGMPPYTVEANFNFEGSSLQFATGFLALGMYTTQLLWNTNVLAGFLVSFHVIDTLGVDSVTSDPIRVDPSDCPAAPTENPFENPENIVYTDQNFSVSYFEDRDRTPMRSPVINSPPSTVPDVDTPISVAPRPLRPKVTQRLERAPSTSAQSDSDMRTLSDTDAARLSMSTSSTLPPSYRTRGSAGSIYVPMPDHPPFPPPVYTPQPTYTPIPRRLSTPRKVPRRRVPAPAPRKVRDDQSARSISAERESRGDRNTGEGERIEGTVTSDSRDS
ncbi:hypothetical protein V8D89_010043 [Ganoderma adspersum]